MTKTADRGAWLRIHAHTDGRVRADVRRDGPEVIVRFTTPGGHASSAAQAELVDSLFALPQVNESSHIRATLPLGESEIILRLAQRCSSLQTRAAGTTCILDGDVAANADSEGETQ